MPLVCSYHSYTNLRVLVARCKYRFQISSYSLLIYQLTCNFLILLAIQNPLNGRIMTITTMPANADGPITCHKNVVLMISITGVVHITGVTDVKSCNFCASTDMRLIISPTVVCLRSALDSRKL